MFKCELCGKYKMGKHNELKYRALNDDDLPETYTMKICEVCTNDFQKANVAEEEFQTKGYSEE